MEVPHCCPSVSGSLNFLGSGEQPRQSAMDWTPRWSRAPEESLLLRSSRRGHCASAAPPYPFQMGLRYPPLLAGMMPG